MAKLKITTEDKCLYEVNGNVSFEAAMVSGELVIEGEMYTHKYFADIIEIETHRYILKDVEIYSEKFGSNDFFILYKFIAKDYVIKEGQTNLLNHIIEKIEKAEFEEEDSKLWEGDNN